jgi:hypothetical protein
MKSRLFDRLRSGVVACSGGARPNTAAIVSIWPRWSQCGCVLLAAILTLSWSFVAVAAEEFSPAERALFMTDHLGGLATPATLRYTFRKSGSLEENFEDKVTVALKAQPKAQCCTATTEFLGGARRVKLPDVESAPGNPVILHFLERDIHEMQRLTKGQPNYFRKRIRMAVFQGAQISDVEVPYRGKMVAARQIVISPYSDDPLRARYEQLADKQYIFTLSKDVPGGIYAIRARVNGASPEGPPLMAEEIVLDPAQTASHETSGTPKQ